MRGSVAKKLRRYVRERYSFMSPETLYRILPNRQWLVGEKCQRALYLAMKKEYKRSKQYG